MIDMKSLVLPPRKILILAALGFTQCSIYLLPYIQNVFYKPVMDTLGVNNAQLGSLLSLYGIIALICYLPGGMLADRYDCRKIITICVSLTGVFGIICAYAVSYHVYMALWILMSLVGNMAFWAASMKSVRLVGSEEEQGKSYGYFYFFNFGMLAVSGAIAVWIFARFTSEAAGIKYVMLFYALLCFISAVLIWTLVPAKNKEYSSTAGEKLTLSSMLSVLKYKETWFFAIMAFSCYTLNNVSYYFTPYFTDVMGLNVATAGIITVLASPMAAIIGPLLGTICDVVGSTLKTIFICLALLAGFFALIILNTGNMTLASAIAVDALIITAAGGAYTIMFAGMEETGMSRAVAGTCIGVASIIGYSPDAFMYTLFGVWLDKYGNAGYNWIFTYSLVLALVGMLAVICLYYLAKKRKKDLSLNQITWEDDNYATKTTA